MAFTSLTVVWEKKNRGISLRIIYTWLFTVEFCLRVTFFTYGFCSLCYFKCFAVREGLCERCEFSHVVSVISWFTFLGMLFPKLFLVEVVTYPCHYSCYFVGAVLLWFQRVSPCVSKTLKFCCFFFFFTPPPWLLRFPYTIHSLRSFPFFTIFCDWEAVV